MNRRGRRGGRGSASRYFAGNTVHLPPLPKEYSASVIRSDGDRSRVYLRGDRRRVETEFSNRQRHVVIARGDLGVGWLWQNADPWLETPMDWELVSGDVDPSTALDWKEHGSANVDGETCIHFRGFADDGTMQEECFVLPSGIRRRMITYRTDGGVGIVVDCVDVELGPPAVELFDLPKNADVQRIGGGITKRCNGPARRNGSR